MQISKPESQVGFTLIEVIIAVTLLALMAGILYGTFYLSHRAVQKTQARSEASQRLRSGTDFLAAYIRSAYPYRTSRQDAAVFFSGDESRLEFVSAFSLGMGGRGMARVSISADQEGDGAGLLILEEQVPVRLQGQTDSAGYRNSLVLSQEAQDFRIEYLDRRGGPQSWVPQWEGKEKRLLPRAVRFTFRGGAGEEVQWVFPIMMSVLAP